MLGLFDIGASSGVVGIPIALAHQNLSNLFWIVQILPSIGRCDRMQFCIPRFDAPLAAADRQRRFLVSGLFRNARKSRINRISIHFYETVLRSPQIVDFLSAHNALVVVIVANIPPLIPTRAFT